MATKNRKVQLESGVDATGARKGFSEIKDAAKDMAKTVAQEGQAAAKGVEATGTGADVAAAKVERAAKSMVAQLQRVTAEARAGSKNSPEYFSERAKQLGIDPALIQPYLKELQAVQQAQRAAQGTLDGMGMSAKQTTAALRQVPAQFTDIVTSLQGGQAPLTVLLQQGGQLKDVFGGIGPAAQALGGYVLGLITPFTLAAGAVAGLGFAYFKGQEEAAAFARTLILTGNVAGTTAERLAVSAASLRSFGVTQGAAAEALNLLAATGKVGAENLGRFADAAVRLGQVGGPAVEDTVKAFADLGRAPLQASLKLNESTNFLTVAVYDQVKALEEQGRTTEAAKVAQEALASALEQRIPRLADTVGLLEAAWKNVAKAAKGALDIALDVGRPQSLEQMQSALDAAQSRAGRLNGGGLLDNFLRGQALDTVEGLRAEIDARKEVDRLAGRTATVDAEQARQIAARAEFGKIIEQNLTKEEKLKREIARIEAVGAQAGYSRVEIEKLVAAARAQAADKTKPKADINDRSSVDAIKRELGELTGAYADAEKILAAQRQAGAISEADYYVARQAFIALNRDAQVQALQAESAELEKLNANRNLSAESRLANEKAIADNASKIVEINNRAAASIEVLGIQQTASLDGVARSYNDARRAAEEYLAVIQRDIARTVNRVGNGDRENEIEQGRDQIRDRYGSERRRIGNERDSLRDAQGGRLDGVQEENFSKRLALQDEFEKKALADYEKGVEARIAAEARWQSGASKAFKDYIANAQNVAGQTEQAFKRGFSGLEDALVTFVTTGKLNFKAFADSVIADLARILIKQQLVAVAKTAATFLGIPGFANGGAFDSMGEVKRFAAGDVFDQPTAFSYAGGSRAGILGEAGPEAIMPLARGAGGKLGVIANDGGSKPLTVNFAPVIQIDGTADKAQSLAQAQQIMRQGQRELLDLLKAKGLY